MRGRLRDAFAVLAADNIELQVSQFCQLPRLLV